MAAQDAEQNLAKENARLVKQLEKAKTNQEKQAEINRGLRVLVNDATEKISQLEMRLKESKVSDDFTHLQELTEEARRLINWHQSVTLPFGKVDLTIEYGNVELTLADTTKKLGSWRVDDQLKESLTMLGTYALEGASIQEKLQELRVRMRPLESVIETAAYAVQRAKKVDE